MRRAPSPLAGGSDIESKTPTPPRGSNGQRRLEDHLLLRGAGTYVDDMTLPDMLHTAVVRSDHAHASILSIGTSEALRMPGVAAVLTAADLTGIDNLIPPISREDIAYDNAPGHPLLAAEKVSYVGQPVAIVVAEDSYLARDAADRVAVRYFPLPVFSDPRCAAEEGAGLVHDFLDSNIAFTTRIGDGDVDASIQAADRIVRARYDVPRAVATPMECRGVLAHYLPGERTLTVWTSTQVPHRVKDYLLKLLDPPPLKVRVVAPDVGGGFGQKGEVFPEEMALGYLAIKLGRPVKWIEERSENMLSYHGRGFTADVEAAVKNDGEILGMRYRIWADLGAYFLTFTAAPSHNVSQRVAGPYTVPAVDVELLGVLTNKSPTGPYRGAGGPEAALFTERTVDLIASELGLDPLEVRRRNLIPASAFPYTTTTGLTYDSGDYPAALTRAMELSDYGGWRTRQAESRASGRLIGVGMATVVKASGGKGQARRSNAIVRVSPAGDVTVVTEITPIGQGTRTSFAQIVAAELGVRCEDVVVLHGDTDLLEWGLGTFASRGLSVAGSAIYEGARQARAKLALVAAHLLDCRADEIVLEDGCAYSAEMLDRSISFAELARAAHTPDALPAGLEPGIEQFVDSTLPGNPFSFAAHVAVVEIDAATGLVRLLDYVAVQDCGPFLNPIIARAQVHGAVVQGIGQALTEGMAYDELGIPLTGNLMNYGVPSAEELPLLVVDNMGTPSPVTPMGMRGIGELPTVAAPSAVANAVDDALAALGARRIDLPLTPDKMWRVLSEARTTAPAGV